MHLSAQVLAPNGSKFFFFKNPSQTVQEAEPCVCTRYPVRFAMCSSVHGANGTHHIVKTVVPPAHSSVQSWAEVGGRLCAHVSWENHSIYHTINMWWTCMHHGQFLGAIHKISLPKRLAPMVMSGQSRLPWGTTVGQTWGDESNMETKGSSPRA